jgi:hypothetical protein
MRSFFFVVFAIVCVACAEPRATSSEAGALAKCARVGQSCEFSPGKLGSCVQRDDCAAGEACFVCQSQH